MDEMMTDAELTEIEARADAAAAGPWVVVPDDYDHRVMQAPDGDDFGLEVCRAEYDSLSDFPPEIRDANKSFIAHARADIPRLIAEIRRLRGK